MSDQPAVAPVQTDDGAATDTGAAADQSTDTVLTGGATNSDAGAADAGTTADGAGADGSAEGGDAGGSDNTGEGSQATPPDTYADFTLPEGMPADAALLESALPIFKELGLTQEQAQKLVTLEAERVQAGSQGQVDAFNQMTEKWQADAKSDSEFGGDKFDENVGVARAAIDKFGTPELKQLLSEHGVGNHPEVIRFMVRVGKLTVEDVPGAVTTPSSKAEDRVSILYPSNKSA